MQKIGFSIDVEEFFHAENMKKLCPKDTWNTQPKQLPKILDRLLQSLDELDIPATFFILGWSAKRLPALVNQIADAGHEIASHGMTHAKLTDLNRKQISTEASESKKLLEDLSGQPIRGFRAPSFSITDTALQVLRECGYTYDSSYHPFSSHKNYGSLKNIGRKVSENLYEIDNGFYELPLPVFKVGKLEIPIGGGAYFRFIPSAIYKRLTLSWLRRGKCLYFYTHPWELAMPELPAELPFLRRIRQSYKVTGGLERMVQWLRAMQKQQIEFTTYSGIIDATVKTTPAKAAK